MFRCFCYINGWIVRVICKYDIILSLNFRVVIFFYDVCFICCFLVFIWIVRIRREFKFLVSRDNLMVFG